MLLVAGSWQHDLIFLTYDLVFVTVLQNFQCHYACYSIINNNKVS